MNRAIDQIKTRRKFLQMLSSSPLLASPGFLAGSFGNLLAASEVTEKKFLGWLDSFQQSDEVISSPDQALNVMDFEAVARKTLPPAHFGYLATGVDDDGRCGQIAKAIRASRFGTQARGCREPGHVGEPLRHEVEHADCPVTGKRAESLPSTR